MFTNIDPKSAVPIYRQIIEQVRRMVAAGTLAAGDRLPSVRELAAQLVINPNTAARVYRELERDGLIETRRGDGTYMSGAAEAMAERERRHLVRARLEEAAAEARALGLSDQEALELFREALAGRRGGRREAR